MSFRSSYIDLLHELHISCILLIYVCQYCNDQNIDQFCFLLYFYYMLDIFLNITVSCPIFFFYISRDNVIIFVVTRLI